MTWIKPESALSKRDFRVHEAGHFVVGTMFGLPMEPPEIFADGTGGRCNWDQAEVKRRAGKPLPELTDKALQTAEQLAALNIAACYMAGFCAEAMAAGDDVRKIFGSRTPDIAHAAQVLMLAFEHDRHLETAWNRARTVLEDAWGLVEYFAENMTITSGTHGHRPLRFLH